MGAPSIFSSPKRKARLVGRAFDVNRYYLQFTKLGELFGLGMRAAIRVFCIDWRRSYFGQG